MYGERKVELLAPAGNAASLRGAWNAGADAVYLAGTSFGARAYADNFTEEELTAALREAHLLGRRVYLTANVLTRQAELPELTAFVRRLADEGLDGVIVQDLGVAAGLRKVCPGLPLHASTQMSVMGAGAVRFLRRQGFTRIVPARELSLEELRLLKETGIEIETFIHGAMCYSCSGRCLMSSFLGGRSGNRGRCAGTCRLPYTVLDERGTPVLPAEISRRDVPKHSRPGRNRPEVYPLSMKDLCALPILPELIDAGIDSFKIEGRMKKSEYAAGVTAVYRKYLDRFAEWDAEGRPGRWEIEPDDLDMLKSLYIRTDLSTGYYHERSGRDMVTIGKPGYRGASPEFLESIRSIYLKDRPRIPIRGLAKIRLGRPVSLSASALSPDAASFTAEGPEPQPAQQHPLTEESIASRLKKTGESSFVFENLEIQTDGKSFLPVSSLNELRRAAMEGLQAVLLQSRKTEKSAAPVGVQEDENSDCGASAPVRTSSLSSSLRRSEKPFRDIFRVSQGSSLPEPLLLVMVMTEEQAAAAREAGADILILDGPVRDHPENVLRNLSVGEPEDKEVLFAALPHLLRASDLPWLTEYYKEYYEDFYGFVTRNLEEVEFLREREYDKTVIADSSLYCWNRSALESLKPYCDANVLPLELDRREMARTFSKELSRMIVPAYGRAPLMITANCVRKTAGRCRLREGTEASGEWLFYHRKDETEAAGEPLFYHLRDRTGARMPVFTDCLHCTNVIYNSVPTSLERCFSDGSSGRNSDGKDPLLRRAGGLLLSFTVETAAETEEIVRRFGGLLREEADVSLQLKTEQAPREKADGAFTYGHYREGAI